jgi:hypothetical protein
MPKHTCELSQALSIQLLKKHGYLKQPELSGSLSWTRFHKTSNKIHISRNDAGDSPQFQLTRFDTSQRDYIQTTSTECFLSGKRLWFVCPVESCGKRVGVLYQRNNYFACRTCHNLAYQSQQDTHTGIWGVAGQYLSGRLQKKGNSMRIKFWKGRPTKRYQRLIRKFESLPRWEAIQKELTS